MTIKEYQSKIQMLSVSSASPKEKAAYKKKLDNEFFNSPKNKALRQFIEAMPDCDNIED